MNNIEWLSKGFIEGLTNGVACLHQSTVVDDRLSHKCDAAAQKTLDDHGFNEATDNVEASLMCRQVRYLDGTWPPSRSWTCWVGDEALL